MKMKLHNSDIKVSSYRDTVPGATYVILVYSLWNMDGNYRVCLKEEGGYHNTQVADVNLHKSGDRRWLEAYIERVGNTVLLSGVFFGDHGTAGTNYYNLETYRENNRSFHLDYLDDLRIPETNSINR